MQFDQRIGDGEAEARSLHAVGHDTFALLEWPAQARNVLGPDEWRVVQLRQDGWAWADIAELLGGSAEALRKQVARALARLNRALGVAEAGHE